MKCNVISARVTDRVRRLAELAASCRGETLSNFCAVAIERSAHHQLLNIDDLADPDSTHKTTDQDRRRIGELGTTSHRP